MFASAEGIVIINEAIIQQTCILCDCMASKLQKCETLIPLYH